MQDQAKATTMQPSGQQDRAVSGRNRHFYACYAVVSHDLLGAQEPRNMSTEHKESELRAWKMSRSEQASCP